MRRMMHMALAAAVVCSACEQLESPTTPSSYGTSNTDNRPTQPNEHVARVIGDDKEETPLDRINNLKTDLLDLEGKTAEQLSSGLINYLSLYDATIRSEQSDLNRRELFVAKLQGFEDIYSHILENEGPVPVTDLSVLYEPSEDETELTIEDKIKKIREMILSLNPRPNTPNPGYSLDMERFEELNVKLLKFLTQ